MQTNAKNNSLTKKVLLSIVAAGLLSGFALSAEAADYIIQGNGQETKEKVNASWVWVERFQGNDSAELTLNAGKVTGSNFEKTPFGSENQLSWYLIGTSYPKDSSDLVQAQVAVFVNKSCTTLIAENVNFTGEVAVNGYMGNPQNNDERKGVAKITINGGSITAGKYYYSITNSTEVRTEENATNILAYYNGQIDLNNVVINSNISAYSGGVINVNNSSADATKEINVAKKIYAADEGSVININFNANEDAAVNTADTNAKGTITVGSQIFADKGARISINNANVTVTKQDGLNNIGTIESTGEKSLIELKNSTITADNLVASDSGKLTLDKNSSATVKAITAAHRFSDDSGGGTIEIYGNFNTNNLTASNNGKVYLQGGADAVYEVTRDVYVSDGGKLYINNGTLEALASAAFKTSGTQYDKIFLEETGIISTISENVYTNAASTIQNNPGELKNSGIVFNAGELILNDAQYNGIVVGADLYKRGKVIVGAALTYVDGSINGSTLAARMRNDATYYGASIYGSLQNSDSAVIGDISYLHGKHDITQHNSGYSLTADAKTDAFSVGVRAERSVKAGAGKYVPYAGLRYLHLSTGNYTNSIGMAYAGDDANLWLLPVGVKYSADVKAGSWSIRPLAEAGYVWSMGDRDATQTVSLNGAGDGFGYDVADRGSYIARLGVEAEKANITYGLGYEYQKGDSVKSNRWTARLNWSF